VADSKPFAPTQSRLQRARREGDVPRAGELVAVASFGAGFAAVVAGLPFVAAAGRRALENAAHGITDWRPYGVAGACALAVVLCAAIASAFVATAVAGGVAVTAPKINLGRLDPAAGLKRMLSRDAAIGAARAALAAAVVTAALVPPVRAVLYAAVVRATPEGLAALALEGIERATLAALAVGAGFGLIDAFVERFKWRRRLRMSFDEMKRDVKQNEGDPVLRSRRRARHRELSQRSLTRLREAAFVVANPTHVAIALAYRPPEIAVPRIVVRALDDVAQTVIARARELRIPVVRNVWLARRLFAAGDVDAYIARDCYAAVAQIVAELIHQGVIE
jgi:flagellar biosynthesis protein FlhB